MQLSYKSPAKINLFLKVLRKRSDGFHDIQTLFERVSLCDRLIFTLLKSGIELKSNSRQIPLDDRNIVRKAAVLLQKEYRVKKGVRIFIDKKIPVAAGLGGGSSNAAVTLMALNKLWRLGLSKPALLRLGARLGSDVPFFILETPYALGLGKGEILSKINGPKGKIWHCLVKPSFGISTKMAYQGLLPSYLTPKKANVRMLLQSIQKGDCEALRKLLINSLELSLNKRVRANSKIKNALLGTGALAALMSGSGSSVFGLFDSKQKAKKAAAILKTLNKNWQVFVVSTL